MRLLMLPTPLFLLYGFFFLFTDELAVRPEREGNLRGVEPGVVLGQHRAGLLHEVARQGAAREKGHDEVEVARRADLESLQQAADDYEGLQQTLTTLPAKVEHRVLVQKGEAGREARRDPALLRGLPPRREAALERLRSMNGQ